jgi:hypothetical protein
MIGDLRLADARLPQQLPGAEQPVRDALRPVQRDHPLRELPRIHPVRRATTGIDVLQAGGKERRWLSRCRFLGPSIAGVLHQLDEKPAEVLLPKRSLCIRFRPRPAHVVERPMQSVVDNSSICARKILGAHLLCPEALLSWQVERQRVVTHRVEPVGRCWCER